MRRDRCCARGGTVEDFLPTTAGPQAGSAEPSAATLVRSPCSPRSAAGRASPREWPLLWLDDGDRYLVVAPDAGRDRDPAWLLNLRADPVAVLQVGADSLRVRAHVATETEARTLWPRHDAMYDGYADYRSRTDRPIPIVILEPLPVV